nr:DsbA family protein [Thalassococcus arenae]
MTDEQRQAFGAQVRAYLLENPQVIMEAVAVLEQQEAEAQASADVSLVQDNAAALFDDGFSWVGGNPDGDITIVEFIDYRCGYCRRAHPEVTELIESDGNIRFVVKEFPILGDASLVSSRFAIATLITAGPDAYKAVHEALIALEGAPNEATLQRIADTMGLDANAIMAEMESPEVARRIDETRALAQRLQINGTPSFVMGERMVRGYVPLDGMRQIVAGERG